MNVKILTEEKNMPFINLRTNIKVNSEKKNILKEEFDESISIISGKSKEWLMIEIDDDLDMFFSGSDAPLCMIELKIYGTCSPSESKEIVNKLTSVVSNSLNISSSRIYVSIFETEKWSIDGELF